MPSLHGPYSAWVSWLDAFAGGTDLPSGHLVPVDAMLGPHMQERLLLRLVAAFDARCKAWDATLQRRLDTGTVRRPSELAAVLVGARRGLRPIAALGADPRLPEPVRDELGRALRSLVDSVHTSLEDSVRRLPRGSEQLLAVIRENRFDPVLSPAPPAPPPVPPTGRRVIFD